LVYRYGSRQVYEIGERTIGWPPTIDVSAGRQWINANEFELIQQALEEQGIRK